MPFRPCPSGCDRSLSADDRHDRCLQCLGFQHAEDAFVDDSCACCGRMSMISLRSRLSFMKGLTPSAATRAGLSGSSRGSPADALGDLRVTVRASPPGTAPRTSYSSRSEHPVRFPGDFAGPSHGAPSIQFGAPSVDRMTIAASGDGSTSSEDEGAVGLPPSGVVATAAPDPELTAMLARAAVSIGLEVNRPPSPEPSRLDDWFLGAGRGSQPRSTPVPFFPEVHEELTKSWMAPFTARSRSSASSILTTLDGGVARGYAGIPQVERAIAVHLCPRNAATWRNIPHLPSKACKLTAALVANSTSSGFSGPWDNSVRCPASSLSPTNHFASSQESTVRGRYCSPRTSGQSRLGPREFGEDASERTAFCNIHPYSLSLHHHRYVDCAVEAACTASGSVAHAAQPVSLAHAHNSTRLRDSVRQATSQVQWRSRDVGGSPERPCLARGDCCPPGKGCNRAGPSSRDEAGVLQPLLHRTQERWWPSANPGSASLEPGFAQAPVQDADAQAHDQMHSAPELVCSDRPEGRLLSHFDPSVTQTVSTVCVRRSGMAVQGPPLRALPVSPCSRRL